MKWEYINTNINMTIEPLVIVYRPLVIVYRPQVIVYMPLVIVYRPHSPLGPTWFNR